MNYWQSLRADFGARDWYLERMGSLRIKIKKFDGKCDFFHVEEEDEGYPCSIKVFQSYW